MIDFVINKSARFTDVIPLLAGEEKCLPGKSFGPYVRSHYLIHYCLSGKGIICDPRGEHSVSDGEIFVIRPNEQTTYTADLADPWHYVWIGFTGTQACRFDTDRSVYPAPRDIFLRLSNLVMIGERSPSPYASVIHDIIHYTLGTEESPTDELSMIRRYVEYNYMKQISVDGIAKDFGIERSYLFRRFKSRYGKGVKEYLTEYRLERAKEILRLGHSVAATSAMVGYPDEFNFSRSFKKHFNISPSEWRRLSHTPSIIK